MTQTVAAHMMLYTVVQMRSDRSGQFEKIQTNLKVVGEGILDTVEVLSLRECTLHYATLVRMLDRCRELFNL